MYFRTKTQRGYDILITKTCRRLKYKSELVNNKIIIVKKFDLI